MCSSGSASGYSQTGPYGSAGFGDSEVAVGGSAMGCRPPHMLALLLPGCLSSQV